MAIISPVRLKAGFIRLIGTTAVILSATTASASPNEQLLDLYPPSIQSSVPGSWTYSQTNATNLSGSSWYSGFNENDVYHGLLKHEQAGSASKSWEIRLGKGGQIYSMRSQFGEAIPPQIQSYAPGSAPWNDEVFQAVSVDTTQNTPQQPYFIHQAGYYVQGNVTAPSYAPMLAHGAVGENMYGTLSWGVQAHDPATHQSGLLNWQYTRDVGDGIVEVTNVLYNFGHDTLNYHNFPWGGTRSSTLGKMLISQPGGAVSDANIAAWDNPTGQVLGLYQTGGWAAFADGTSDSSLGLGIVFGNSDPHLSQPWQYAGSSWRWGRGGGTGRDYLVGTVQRHVNIAPNDLFYSRYYLVFGTVGEIQQSITQNGLVGDAGYDMLNVSETSATELAWRVEQTDDGVVVRESTSDQADFLTYSQPVRGSKPLFLLEDAAGQEFIAIDPYTLSAKPYDGATKYKGLLGFVLPAALTNSQGTAIPYVELAALFPGDSSYYRDASSGMQVVAGPVFLGVPGDYNTNGIVDASDYTVWRDTLGSTNDLRADGNHDGQVTAADFEYWKARFGNTSGGGSSEFVPHVPEPSSVSLALLASCLLACARRVKTMPK
jgi:Dockerin type I domain